MEPIYTYKAISFELRFVKRKPLDIFLAGFCCFMLFAISDSFLIALIFLVIAWRKTKKIALRPAGTIRSTIRHLMIPNVLGVIPNKEIPAYENVMKKTND